MPDNILTQQEEASETMGKVVIATANAVNAINGSDISPRIKTLLRKALIDTQDGILHQLRG